MPGSKIEDATLIDIAPTILALEGIAPAKDMPGRVLGEALRTPVPERTVETFEASSEEAGSKMRQDASVDPAILARLEALGYLEAQSPRSGKNLGAVSFEAGDFEGAVLTYREHLKSNPNDAGVHTSLAGVLGSLERYDEALFHLGEALRFNPLNSAAYHNRAVIHERQGDREKAISDYRKAMRYGSGYAPSRKALVRLTGTAQAEEMRTEDEKAAARLAHQASVSARKGRYDEAMALIDRAEKIAPDFALVHQYRANVAFLKGDPEVAQASLERAVMLEPENPLFQRNLKAVKSGSQSPAVQESAPES